MINALNEAGVNTIDMDAWYEENDWDMDDVYFKTDHHWLPSAALAAADVTMDFLSEKGLAEYEEEFMDADNYTITTLKDWFLGSRGKRVGTYYAGVDDIDIYFPNFETNYSYSGLHVFTSNWTYSDSPLDLSYVEEKDYFDSDPHCIYLYGEDPLQIITNTEAVNDKRVLVVGDSYRRSWQYFMTTEFQEVYSIDLRYYDDGTLAEYIEEIQPDIVIMCICSNSITNEDFYNYGIEEYQSALEATSESDAANVISLGDFTIDAEENNNHNSVVVCANLEPNQIYTLTLDSTSYTGGDDLYVQLRLQNLTTNSAIYDRYLDANSEEEQSWIFTTPDNDECEYAIYLYAGTYLHTENASVEVTGIEIQKGICED